MAGNFTQDFSFVGGVVRDKELTYISLVGDEATARKVRHAMFNLWDSGEWYHCADTHWNAVGLAVVHKPVSQLVAVGQWGDVLCSGSGDTHNEHVAANSPQQLSDRGPLTSARRIGDAIYAAGMDRQVYRRSAAHSWQEFGPGMRPDEAKEVKGFQSIDGFSEQDIYAVGWDGEIFHYDGASWNALPSITNVVLVDVCCGGDGAVYVCGREGLLLKGRGSKWDIVDTDGLTEDLWGLAWYNGQLYTSSMYNLYTLGQKGLTQVSMGKDTPGTFHRLSADDGVLWSIGAKDIMAFDGKTWMRIE